MTPGTGAILPVPDLLARLRQVPPDAARFDTAPEVAAGLLRVDPAYLTALAAAGLQHASDPERGPLFDYTDLTNVAYLSGTGLSVPELAWRFLLRFADSPPDSWYRPTTWLVTVRPPRPPDGLGQGIGPLVVAVPDPDAPGVELLDPGETGAADAADVRPPVVAEGYQAGAYRSLVRLTGTPDRVRDSRVRSAYDETVDALVHEDVRYQAVPEPLRADHRRAWALGMADCVVSSKLLAERLAGLGLRTRVRRGYVLGLLGADHTWCEVVDEDRWKTLDPVFAYLAARKRTAAQFRDACCGGRFNRLLPCSVREAAPLIVRASDELVPLWALAAVSARPWKPDLGTDGRTG